MRRLIGLLLVFVPFAGCNDSFNPVSPSSYDDNTVQLHEWSPYINAHTPSQVLEPYQKVIPELISAGALQGMRINITKGEGYNFVNAWIATVVPDVLWILDNNYLFETDIEGVIDRVFGRYPDIRYLQIGNETTTILPEHGPQISIETYMEIFKRINFHIQNHYPGVDLVTQSTFGAGSHGPKELERMVELGLKDISPKPIVAMNVYSVSTANQYSYVISRSLRGHRIWVTETGVNDPVQHIRYVGEMYPTLKNILRAERVYWYVLYGGEGGSDYGFGLIRDITEPTIWTSPLYDALTRK